MEFEDGEVITVGVEYTWKPQKCHHCMVFSHLAKACPKGYVKPKMGWVPRSSLNKDDGSGSGIQNEIVEANSSDDWTQVSNRNARKDGSLKGKNCPLSPV